MYSSGLEVFIEDETAVQLFRTRPVGRGPPGKRFRTTHSRKSIRIFGAMSRDELRVNITDSANSETFLEFLREIQRDHPRFYMVLNNSSYHKSRAVI